MSSDIRVLLVDDHSVLRAGLRVLLELEPDLRVVGEAGTGEEGLERAMESNPDVVVMDLSMPGMGGLEATARITAAGERSRVLALTMHAGREYLPPVLQVGGSGYVCKTTAAEDVVRAVRTVARGEVFLYPSAIRLLLRNYESRRDGVETRALEELTDRERHVLELTGEGFSSREVGEQIFTTSEAVDSCRLRIVEKLRLNRRSVLMRLAEAGRLDSRAGHRAREPGVRVRA